MSIYQYMVVLNLRYNVINVYDKQIVSCVYNNVSTSWVMFVIGDLNFIYIVLIVNSAPITKGISTSWVMSAIGDINFIYIMFVKSAPTTNGISTSWVMSAIGDINFIYIILIVKSASITNGTSDVNLIACRVAFIMQLHSILLPYLYTCIIGWY